MQVKRTIVTVAIAASALFAGNATGNAIYSAAFVPPAEDEPGFSCVDQGNHICGPGSEAPAGLYDQGGVLIQPWTNYEHPEQDPLYGVLPGTEYSLDAQELAGPAECTTDADCARYALRNGMGFNGDSLGLPSGIVVDGYVTTEHGFEPVSNN